MFGLDNPNRLLQSYKNVNQFAQELYAMFTPDKPVDTETPVTIRVPEGQTAITLKRGAKPPELPGPASPRVKPGPVSPPSPPEPFTPQGPASKGRNQATADAFPQPQKKYRPIMSVDGGVDFKGREPIRFDTPPQLYNPDTRQYEPLVPARKDIPNPAQSGPENPALPARKDSGIPASSPNPENPPIYLPPDIDLGVRALQFPEGNPSLTGLVTGTGSDGTTWTVTPYPTGKTGLPDPGGDIIVNILNIDPAESAPVGLWIMPIIQYGVSGADSGGAVTSSIVYYYSPPLWLGGVGDDS